MCCPGPLPRRTSTCGGGVTRVLPPSPKVFRALAQGPRRTDASIAGTAARTCSGSSTEHAASQSSTVAGFCGAGGGSPPYCAATPPRLPPAPVRFARFLWGILHVANGFNSHSRLSPRFCAGGFVLCAGEQRSSGENEDSDGRAAPACMQQSAGRCMIGAASSPQVFPPLSPLVIPFTPGRQSCRFPAEVGGSGGAVLALRTA